MTEKSFLYQTFRVLKGFVIGAAGIVPGASGGVLAVAMGEYHATLDAVYDLFRHPRKNFRSSLLYLLPLGIGILAGILACSFLLEFLLLHYEEALMFALIGIVMGGVPSLIREGNAGGVFRPSYALYSLLGILLVSLMAFGESALTKGAALPFNACTAMLSGAILVIGVVIPGISTSFILMFMGLYAPMLRALTAFDLPMLFFLGLGALLMGSLLFLFVRHMFKKHNAAAHYSILGFLLGTILLIFPGISKGHLLFDLLLLAGGFSFSLFSALKMQKSGKEPH